MVERYIVYSILRENGQPYRDDGSGHTHGLLVAECTSAARALPPLPPPPSSFYPRAVQLNLGDKRNVCMNAMQHDKQSKTKSNSQGTLKRKE